jgi:hypothetical protein
MDDRLLIMLGVSVAFGLIVGPFVARMSSNKEKIHGGFLSQLFHFIAVVLFTGLVPGVITGIIVGEGLLVIPIAFAMLGVVAVSLILFATVENAPRKAALSKKVDRGWTEEDARKSGL